MSIANAKGDIKLLKRAYDQHLAMGEGAVSSNFELIIKGKEKFSTLVQATQIPAFSREEIETFAPLGVQFTQQGSYNNSGEMSITFKEVISGAVLEMIRDSVAKKEYLTLELKLICESLPNGVEPLRFRLSHCFIKLDATDLSVEDRTAIVKPSGTIRYNWAELLSGKGY
ncbi:hypothetical protein [Endozoicomonas lisbonensis]|uniref:Uncharacterized protein n=1 Tax=Endozoicomonas lisbonensis TaxID=3120522 RepID=A0ABV2SP90_9GAMM